MTRSSLLKKSMAAGTAVFFAASVVLTPAAEANFWSERRQAASRVNSGGSPSEARESKSFASLIPAIDAVPKIPVVYQEWGLATDPERAGLAARLPDVLKSLPQSAADIREARFGVAWPYQWTAWHFIHQRRSW